jgi:uncharacterized protein DUF6794
MIDKNVPIPNTFDRAIKTLLEEMPVPQQIEIMLMSESELNQLHHTMGTWIRNYWKLWVPENELTKDMMAMGFMHADDMSGSIIREYWARLNKLPSTINKEIEEYKQFWKAQ